MKKTLIAIVSALLVLPSIASADDMEQVCARYQRSDGSWSQHYKLKGMVVDGSKLNEATKTYDFNSWDKYLFIPWEAGGYTIIKLDIFGLSTLESSPLKDRRGVKWKVSKGWSLCF